MQDISWNEMIESRKAQMKRVTAQLDADHSPEEAEGFIVHRSLLESEIIALEVFRGLGKDCDITQIEHAMALSVPIESLINIAEHTAFFQDEDDLSDAQREKQWYDLIMDFEAKSVFFDSMVELGCDLNNLAQDVASKVVIGFGLELDEQDQLHDTIAKYINPSYGEPSCDTPSFLIKKNNKGLSGPQ